MKAAARYSEKLILLGILAAALGIFFGSFMIGRYPVSPDAVLAILLSNVVAIPKTWTDTMEVIVIKVRLPRIEAALLVGGALAVSGAAYQNLFRNPLVSPAILGVSAGAGFGAALGMILHVSWPVVQVMAFGMGLTAAACSVGIATYFANRSIIAMVLGGMVVGALFQALISVLKYMADPSDTLPAITFWLMGGLSKMTSQDVAWSFLPILVPMLVLYALRWQIHVLAIGEEEAATLGIHVRRVQMLVMMSATLMTAAAVSISGIIGWVGLLIPHMARMLVGGNFSVLLPASLLLGSGYLLLMDNLSRSLVSVEIPVGILTAIVGAPFFVILLARTKTNWS